MINEYQHALTIESSKNISESGFFLAYFVMSSFRL